MNDNEKRMWLMMLRAKSSLPLSMRAELADILEREWFPPVRGAKGTRKGRRGRDELTSREKLNINFRAMGLRSEVEALQANGLGRDDAEEAIAAQRGIGRRALQKQMRFIPTKRK